VDGKVLSNRLVLRDPDGREVAQVQRKAGRDAGEKATLLWDGLPVHRSRAMLAWLRAQRSWLVVERLPAYAPELNPVEGLWSSLKSVELANLTGSTLGRCSPRPTAASNEPERPRTWPPRSCGTPACRSLDRGQPLPKSSAMVEESSPPGATLGA
jgi:DDE superfamily endonuclease